MLSHLSRYENTGGVPFWVSLVHWKMKGGSRFQYQVGPEVLASEQKLREMWQETAQGTFLTFRGFVDFLLSIGLVGLAELQEKEQGYRFAEIYTYGFNMYRGRRKY